VVKESATIFTAFAVVCPATMSTDLTSASFPETKTAGIPEVVFCVALTDSM